MDEELARMGLAVATLTDALRDQGLTVANAAGRTPTLSLSGRLREHVADLARRAPEGLALKLLDEPK